MMSLFWRLALVHIAYTFGIWSLLIAIGFVYFDQQSSAGILGALFMATVIGGPLAQRKCWPELTRHFSSDVPRMWSYGFRLLTFQFGTNLCVSLAIWWWISRLSGAAGNEAHSFHIFWVPLIAFLISLNASFDHRLLDSPPFDSPQLDSPQLELLPQDGRTNTARHERSGFQVLAGWLWLPATMIALGFSLLLAYAVVSSHLLSLFFFQSKFVISVLSERARRFCAVAGLVGIFCLWTFSTAFFSANDAGWLKFFSLKESEVETPILSEITFASQWADWVEAKTVRSAEEIIRSLEILESICPPVPSDALITIQCFEKGANGRIVPVQNQLDETGVLKALNSSSLYAQALGLVSARSLSQLSPELKDKITALKSSPGRLGAIAEVTLSEHSRWASKELKVVVLSPRGDVTQLKE